MSKVSMAFSADADKSRVKIDILEDGTAKASIVATAPQLDALIAALVGIRARILPEVAHEAPGVAALRGPLDPRYATYDIPVLPGRMLAVRHSGLGWLSFIFPEKEAQSIAGALQKPLAAPSFKPPPTRQ